MAHYKPLKRISERTGSTPTEWLKACSEIGMLVNGWSGRYDLVIYGGADAADNEAIAAYYADSAEIEIDVVKAFDGALPESIGRLHESSVQYEFPHVIGVAFHEALHAKHTNWDKNVLMEKLDSAERNAFMTLEESRIEARGVVEIPNNIVFLRESALTFALEGVDEAAKHGVSEVWQAALFGALALARNDCGVLRDSDVYEIKKAITLTLGEELLEKLRAIWVEFQGLKVSKIDRALVLAKEWVALLREADPEGEGSQEQLSSEALAAGEGTSSFDELIKKVMEEVSDKNARAIEGQEAQEKWEEQAKSRESSAKSNDSKKLKAKEIFDKRNTAVGSGSSSKIQTQRAPESLERIAAVKIGQMLDKAKYRERSMTTLRSVAPQGKLKTRIAIQNAASKSRGSHTVLPAWERRLRKSNDEPTLRLGVMVDISGSMFSAMEAMATTAWVLGEAGHRIQAKTAMVYYGSGVFPTLRVGQRLSTVNVYSASDYTEMFGEAWSALDGELSLTGNDGVRILVVVSDGQYTPEQFERAETALKECKQNGVAVLWITPKDCYGDRAKSLLRSANWGVHLDQMIVTDIAMSVGNAAAEALGKVGSLT